MNDRPSFETLTESASIAALLAELDAPPAASPEGARREEDAPAARAPDVRPADVPPPLPLPEAFSAMAMSPPPHSRPAGETFAGFNWRNPAPRGPAAGAEPPAPERALAPWLHDEPKTLMKPVPVGRYRLDEFLISVNWRNGKRPPALPERLRALVPAPSKPGLLDDLDAEAGDRRGRQFSVAEVFGPFAFE